MNKIYKLDEISERKGRAHVKLVTGEEFDCTPDCIVPDEDWSDMILLRIDGKLSSYREEEIESVKEL